MFNEKLGQYATRSLSKNGVILKNNMRVQEVKESSVITNTREEIHAETIIWTAGVSAEGLKTERQVFSLNKGKISVDQYMKAIGVDDVYVVGDMSYVATADGRGYPMTAQVAQQQGIWVAKNLNAIFNGNTAKKFKYREKGILASLGNYDAVADISGFSFYGLFAWFMWRTIYLFNFISWRKRFKIMLDWTINLFSERDISHL